MHDQNKAIIKSLVSVAWADGVFAEEEKQIVEALLQAFEATPQEAEEIRDYAKTPKTLDDVPITDLSFDDRRVLLQHAVLLSHADGDPSEPEIKLIDELVIKLRISQDEAKVLRDIATERANRLKAKL